MYFRILVQNQVIARLEAFQISLPLELRKEVKAQIGFGYYSYISNRHVVAIMVQSNRRLFYQLYQRLKCREEKNQ